MVKKTIAIKADEMSWTRTLLESAVGEPLTGEDSTSGIIRRFYTNNYKALDQFDALWYACSYNYRDSCWQTCYLWAIILDCVVNARSAWCEARGEQVTIKAFISHLIEELDESLSESH